MTSTTMTLCALFMGPSNDLRSAHTFKPQLRTVRCGQTHKTLFVRAPFVWTHICIRSQSATDPLSAMKSRQVSREILSITLSLNTLAYQCQKIKAKVLPNCFMVLLM